jgi:thiol-disulfide isomerase/thioredoxin
LVYVGAKWCEPCRRFHEAALKNELAGGIDGLSLLEFDLDADSERLAESGYVSKYIPLFALPADDGIASGKQIEGSVKGPGAADDITPRLRALIGR